MFRALSLSAHKMARVALALVLLILALHPGNTANSAPAASPGVTPIGFAQPEFQAVWNHTDALVAAGQAARSWLWGPAPGQSKTEAFADAPGGARSVQYYDKARMELDETQPSHSSQWRVTTGLLVYEMVAGKIQVGSNAFLAAPPSDIAVAGDADVPTNPRYSTFAPHLQISAVDHTGATVTETLPGLYAGTPPTGIKYAQFVSETGHNIPDVFWNYMHATGRVLATDGSATNEKLFDWVYLLGYPITEAYWARVSIGGKSYPALVQLFQRRTLTYIADMPTGWQVQMGNVGQHYFAWRYGPTPPPAQSGGKDGSHPATPLPTPTALPPIISFVSVSGDQFVYVGAPVKLKGTNYWLSSAPFSGTWSSWDGPKTLSELQKAKALGVNTVRVGLPFDHRDTRDVVWDSDPQMRKISPWIQSQMTQLLQISGLVGMKVIFVLFDWYDGHPAEGTIEETQNIAYLQGIVGPFANDDRVLAWDIHNEPDNYTEWSLGGQQRVVEWLGRMTKYLRYLDARHPVTVGMGNYQNLWQPDPTGRTVLDFVDFASFHCYDANALPTQVAAIRAHTRKPVLLEEMGWPTSPGAQPPTPGATYDEATQTFLYTKMLEDARKLNIAGVAQWTLMDFQAASTSPLANFEEHFGLYRLDGSPKPAADVFRQSYTARDLPSETTSNIPLDTADHPKFKP